MDQDDTDALSKTAGTILSYSLLTRMFAESADAVFITDGNRIIAVNREAETMFGYHSSQMIGQSVDMLLPESLRPTHSGHRDRYLTAPKHRPMGVGLVLNGRHSTGREFAVEINLNSFQETEGLRVVATVRRAHQTGKPPQASNGT